MIVEYDCIVCGKHVRKRRSPANVLSTPKYCSQACHGAARKGNGPGRTVNTEYQCAMCGKTVQAYRSPANKTDYAPKYCSPECTGKGQRRQNNPAYTGGRITRKDGYIWRLAPDHPYAGVRGYVLEHRLVMEQQIGRYLDPKEVVHHINENKSDNRPENLMLFASQRKHMQHHRSLEAQVHA